MVLELQCFAAQNDEPNAPKVRILVIWFGANDAALPHTPQHVPLERYKANLTTLVQAVRSPASPRYSPETCVILMTPPPVQHERWALGYAAMKGVAVQVPDWDFDMAKMYAEGVVEVGGKEGVPVVDVWTKMWEAAGKDMDKVGEFLFDGLHLNAKGYEVRTSCTWEIDLELKLSPLSARVSCAHRNDRGEETRISLR